MRNPFYLIQLCNIFFIFGSYQLYQEEGHPFDAEAKMFGVVVQGGRIFSKGHEGGEGNFFLFLVQLLLFCMGDQLGE